MVYRKPNYVDGGSIGLLRVYRKPNYRKMEGVLVYSGYTVNQTIGRWREYLLLRVYCKPNYVDGGSISLLRVYRKPNYRKMEGVLVYSGYTVNQTIGRWREYWFTPGIL